MRYSSTTDASSSPSSWRIESIWRAQEVLALLLLGARLHVVADAAADLQLGQALALELDGALEALGHVERPRSSTFSSKATSGE